MIERVVPDRNPRSAPERDSVGLVVPDESSEILAKCIEDEDRISLFFVALNRSYSLFLNRLDVREHSSASMDI